VNSGPNPEETNEASHKQQREKNARGANEQRRQEAEERLERKLIRQEERKEREQVRQEERRNASGSARKHGVRRRAPHEQDGPGSYETPIFGLPSLAGEPVRGRR
jgi:hypothetical protein